MNLSIAFTWKSISQEEMSFIETKTSTAAFVGLVRWFTAHPLLYNGPTWWVNGPIYFNQHLF